MSDIALPPGVEVDEPKVEAPPDDQSIVTLKITFEETTGKIWANGPVGNEALCDLMLKRVQWMPMTAIQPVAGEPGTHVLLIHWDRKNLDPVTAFAAQLSTALQMNDLEGEMFIDWLCKKGKAVLEANQAMMTAKAQQNGVQMATEGMLKGMRLNGRMPQR